MDLGFLFLWQLCLIGVFAETPWTCPNRINRKVVKFSKGVAFDKIKQVVLKKNETSYAFCNVDTIKLEEFAKKAKAIKKMENCPDVERSFKLKQRCYYCDKNKEDNNCCWQSMEFCKMISEKYRRKISTTTERPMKKKHKKSPSQKILITKKPHEKDSPTVIKSKNGTTIIINAQCYCDGEAKKAKKKLKACYEDRRSTLGRVKANRTAEKAKKRDDMNTTKEDKTDGDARRLSTITITPPTVLTTTTKSLPQVCDPKIEVLDQERINEICKQPSGRYPAKQCTDFYECFAGGNATRLIVYGCPAGMNYNDAHKTCQEKAEFPCEDKGTTLY